MAVPPALPGLTPEEYDVVVIKTPHAQPEMFDTWCL
jgi:hypothetical protein